MMIIDISTLRVGVPQDVECVSLTSLPESYGVAAPCPTRVRGMLMKSDANTIICEGTLTTMLKIECGRCLDIVEYEMSLGFCENIERDAQSDVVDISTLVNENIILNIPQKVLCAENCKGLCAVCGTSLNNQDCACEGEVDPRLGALKNLFQGEGGERDGNLPKR